MSGRVAWGGVLGFAGFWSRGVLWAGCTLLVAAALSCAQTSQATGDTSQPVEKPAPEKSPAHSASSSSAKTHTSTKSGAHSGASTHKTGKKSRKSANWRRKGQQKIDRQRALQIQTALIREHYMDGKPSGVWDDATQKAMQKYQADNGWQSKTTPDARALIKLGLGPDQGALLNPESAMTSVPAAANSTRVAAPNADGGAAGKSQPQR
jgi:hypothetical protein